MREIFRKARAAAPSIIFFVSINELVPRLLFLREIVIWQDEIDSLATARGSSDMELGSHEGVLTSLLNEIDGVQELVGVTIVAATNRPEVIVSSLWFICHISLFIELEDAALMRPGRLDRILYVGPPDQSGREEILRIKLKSMSVEDDIDLGELAKSVSLCISDDKFHIINIVTV